MGLRYLGEAFIGPDGSAVAPTFSFGSEPDTGMFLPFPKQLGFVVDGTPVGVFTVDEFAANEFAVDGNITALGNAYISGQAQLGSGSAADPAFTFTSDPDTGMYRYGANQIGFSIGGALGMTIDSTRTHVRGQFAVGLGSVSSSNNPLIELPASVSSSYTFYADNTGAGSDNSRLWLDGPNNGEVVIGPRLGGSRLAQLRLRANNVLIDTPPYSGSTGYDAWHTGNLKVRTPHKEWSGSLSANQGRNLEWSTAGLEALEGYWLTVRASGTHSGLSGNWGASRIGLIAAAGGGGTQMQWGEVVSAGYGAGGLSILEGISIIAGPSIRITIRALTIEGTTYDVRATLVAIDNS